MRALALPLSFGLLFAVGCGGGGAGPASAPDQQVGPMTVSGEVRALAPTLLSGGATLYAITGTVSKVNFTDANPTVDETEVVFVGARGTAFAIMACSPDGTGLRVILNDVGIVPRMEVIGDWVYYVTPTEDLRRVRLSGGASVLVKATVSRFSSNLAGTKVYAYQTPSVTWPNGRFISFNLDGTGVAHMFPAPFTMTSADYFPGLLSDGSLVLVDNTGPTSTSFTAHSVNGTQRPGGKNHSEIGESVSMENGTDLVYLKTVGYTQRLLASGISSWQLETLSAPRSDYDMAIAPGGSRIAFANGVTFGSTGILVDTVPLTATNRIFAGSALVVSWGPLVKARTFVGTGGAFSAAGAFLFSERGSVLPAVVWADATTRSSIQLTKVSADGAQNVVYRLNCDDLTKLSYSNSLNYTPTHVVTAASGLKGAFISFNGDTGKVESLSTFAATPTVSVVDGTLKIEGAKTVVDAEGVSRPAPKVIEFR